MTVMATKWKNQEVRSHNGLLCSNGDLYDVHATRMARVREKQELGGWLNVAILGKKSCMVDSTWLSAERLRNTAQSA